jgi:hypothetical protein
MHYNKAITVEGQVVSHSLGDHLLHGVCYSHYM